MTTSQTPLPSNIRFGWFLTSVLLVVALFCYFGLAEGSSLGVGLFIAALISGFLTVLKPTVLSPFNRVWFFLGELLGKIISPLVLGAIFFLIITPTALICRALGRDELRLKRKAQPSYWTDRKSPTPRGDSFNNQF